MNIFLPIVLVVFSLNLLPNRFLDPEILRKTTEIIQNTQNTREATPSATPLPTPTPSPHATRGSVRQRPSPSPTANASAQFRFQRPLRTRQLKLSDRTVEIATREGKLQLIDRGVVAEIKEGILYGREKISSLRTRRPINVLPQDVKRKIPGAKSITLVDEAYPEYIVEKELKGTMFGFFPITRVLTHKIDAQTGELTKQDPPWWWKHLIRETTLILREGETCPINGPPFCESGTKCEYDIAGVVVTVTQGECRKFPHAVHGRIIVVTPEDEVLGLHTRIKNLPENVVLDIKTFFDKVGCPSTTVEVPMDTAGNFAMDDMPIGHYKIYSLITFTTLPDKAAPYNWKFTVNAGEESDTIDLTGQRYNDNNQIQVTGTGAGFGIPSCTP